MNIEDFILTMAMVKVANYNSWDQTLIYSFADQINRGMGFTEKQANLATKIVKRHSAALSVYFNNDISSYVANPTFRYAFRTINTNKKISVITNSVYGKVVKVEFPYNEKYVTQIKKERDKFFFAQWDKDEKAWIFSLTEESVSFLLNFAKTEQFDLDDEFKKYCDDAQKIIDDLENHIPMLVLDQNEPKFVNIPSNLPQIESKDIISAVFEARNKGILTWDNQIGQTLNNADLKTTTLHLLKTDPGENFHINSQKTPISDLVDIVKYMSPCLFIIPGGSELEKLSLSHKFLLDSGITSEEISVMFRLPSETDKNFNDYVRSNKLNNPISEKTCIIFVSSKLPKPVIKSNIHFNSVINLGHGNVHYTMREFVQKHENLIFYSENTKLGNIDFADL